MARSYGAGKFQRAGEGDAVVLEGFAQLQAALKRIEDGTYPELRERLRAIGEHVKARAEGNITHRTGRHGAEGPRLGQSLKVSVTQRSASVYSTAVHGGAQNVGAWTRDGRGPHISRANASHYMDKAVKSEQAFVEQETEALIQWLLTTFEE